eukprot:TRINITY_DN4669_c0_g1_i1.p1 TRINITY_DN4669_c0_g1~~TRINITY_DN4669_c0_g1_i1.p1  ORF type:complete len:446 (+),score=105.65 TRINITY_DN4669_c0_g1_i1:63-1400(+)
MAAAFLPASSTAKHSGAAPQAGRALHVAPGERGVSQSDEARRLPVLASAASAGVAGALGRRRRHRCLATAVDVPTRPTSGSAFSAPSESSAPSLVRRLWSEVGLPRGDKAKEAAWLSSFATDALVEDLYLSEVPSGTSAGVRAYLDNKAECGRLVIDRLSDGDKSCGFTWHLEEDGEIGIRGTTFVQIDEQGLVSYLREVCEPLYKPGDLTVELLKAVSGANVADFGSGAEVARRTPSGASDLCRYLWSELQGRAPPDESLSFFADEVLYEDFNYEMPMRGKAEVGAFLEKFAEIKALKFVAERFSDGEQSCCFTWNVEIAGTSADAPKTRGISFYELDANGQISYVRDIPESLAKPPPLQALAAALRPKLRVLQGRSSVVDGEASAEPCNCAEAGGVVWPTGECVDGQTILAQTITRSDGTSCTMSQQLGQANGAVVVFLRHLG